MLRTNYIFVDFESVQETDLERVADKHVHVTYVLGEHHKKLPLVLVKKLLAHARQVRLVETGSSGRNAADIVLASYVGEVKKRDPQGYFHILSKDKGFDALVGHHKANGVLAARHESFAEIPVPMNLTERANFLIARFQSKQISRAKKRATLESQIQAVFAKALSPDDLKQTIEVLMARKVIEINAANEVAYKL